MENIAISVNNVTKTFKLDQRKGVSKIIKKIASKPQLKILKALDNVSFNVERGEIMGIIGLNGCGKTTLLRIIAGIYKPNIGDVQVNGKLSPLMQLGAGFQYELNAQENVIMNGMLLGISKSVIKEKVDDIIRYAELEKFSYMKLKHFSSGMRSRLAFSTAIQVNPDILLVDEILSVGDKDFQKKSFEAFLDYKKNNKTILHATHSLSKVAEISDRVLLLDKGRILKIGKPNEVIEEYKKTKSYK